MAYSFWVLMQKRSDGYISADLPKSTGKIYLLEEDAIRDQQEDETLRDHYFPLALIASTYLEYNNLMPAKQKDYKNYG